MSPHIVKPDRLINPNNIVPLNDVSNKDFYDELVKDMRCRGWYGRPLLLFKREKNIFAITGSHRIAAARTAKIKVPVVFSKKWYTHPLWPSDAVKEYLLAAFQKNPSGKYEDRTWWLLRMEGQAYMRGSGMIREDLDERFEELNDSYR